MNSFVTFGHSKTCAAFTVEAYRRITGAAGPYLLKLLTDRVARCGETEFSKAVRRHLNKTQGSYPVRVSVHIDDAGHDSGPT
jgi:hypothetical protein